MDTGMTLSNAELVERFVNGGTSGKANRMRIVEGPISHGGTQSVLEGETAIIGYGWAVYAKRSDSGRVVVFNGWRDWAEGKDGHSGSSTLQHLSMIENEAEPTMLYDHRQAQSTSAPDSAESMKPAR